MRRMVAVALALLLVGSLPGAALSASSEAADCGGASDRLTWDIVQQGRLSAPVDGVEASFFRIPPASSWVTCRSTGSAVGHLALLVSLARDASLGDIVQLGLVKNVGPGGISWLFMYTPDDQGGGEIVPAGAAFPEPPVAGHSYRLRIQAEPSPRSTTGWDWDYCVADLDDGHTNCWLRTAHWRAGDDPWYGGETANESDVMGARPESPDFLLLAPRWHLASGIWISYDQRDIIGYCRQGGWNRFMVNCNSLTTEGHPGFFLWQQEG